MRWRTGLKGKKPFGRLTVRKIQKGDDDFFYDVGPDELERIVTQSGSYEIRSWGVYRKNGWRRKTEEFKRIKQIIEENDSLEG